jgi:hypothetical protein
MYENLDVLPRAFLLYEWQWQEDAMSSVAAMASPAFDPRQTAVLIPGSSPQPPPPAGGGAGQVDIVAYEPERVVLRTTSSTAGLLLLSDAYYPGWQATVDNQATPIYQANALFRGLMVPAGQHEVVFTFRPASVRTGRTVSLLGISLWLVLLIVTSFRSVYNVIVPYDNHG